ncbi:hypothetical protein ADUPG1_007083, partial [Aduncisulcus paluster]
CEELAKLPPGIIESVKSSIIDLSPFSWDEIFGFDDAKQLLLEYFVIPSKFPQFFYSSVRYRRVALLLFGSPGVGKSILARSLMNQIDATFFHLSASQVLSKSGELFIQGLFTLALHNAPSVIIMDDFDKISSGYYDERELLANRRIRTELLYQIDQLSRHKITVTIEGQTYSLPAIIFIGTTSSPYNIDGSLRKRFDVRLYCELPDLEARIRIIQTSLSQLCEHHGLGSTDISELAVKMDGFCGADIFNLIHKVVTIKIRDSRTSDVLSSTSKESSEVLSDYSMISIKFDDFAELIPKYYSKIPSSEQKRILDKFYSEYGTTYENRKE